MRRGLVLLCLLWPIVAQAQPPFLETVVRAGDLVAWDFVDADLSAQQIVRFEVCFDTTGNCVTALPSEAIFVDASPRPAGTSSYTTAFPTTFVAGSLHSVTVKACSASACGPIARPLAFRWVVPPTAVPSNLRVRPGGSASGGG